MTEDNSDKITSEIKANKIETKDNKIDWWKQHFSIIAIALIILSLASAGAFLLVTNQRLAQETREGDDALATKKTNSPSPSASTSPIASSSASPSGSPQTYTPPDYPSCPAGTQRFTATGDISNQSGKNVKNHTLNVSSGGSISKIVGVKKEGHPEEGCKAGPGNDSGKSTCDQNQLNEGFKILVNGTAVTTINDEGTGKDDQWFGFDSTLSPAVALQSGNNTLQFEHIGGSGIGSVEYKTSFCYALVQATATPSQTPRPTATSTPGVGGPDNTPTPTPTQTPGSTATSTPAPTQVTQATATPDPASTNPPTTVANASNSPTNPPVTTAAVEPDRRAVADAGSEQLPKAGILEQTMGVAGIGIASLCASFIFHKRKKRFV